MTKLPTDAKPKKVLKVLKKIGFRETNKVGSHVHLHHPDCRRTQVAVHPKPIAKGTLRAILREAEISADEIKKLL